MQHTEWFGIVRQVIKFKLRRSKAAWEELLKQIVRGWGAIPPWVYHIDELHLLPPLVAPNIHP